MKRKREKYRNKIIQLLQKKRFVITEKNFNLDIIYFIGEREVVFLNADYVVIKMKNDSLSFCVQSEGCTKSLYFCFDKSPWIKGHKDSFDFLLKFIMPMNFKKEDIKKYIDGKINKKELLKYED